jgi:DNA-binding transcriptional LysR family regulator
MERLAEMMTFAKVVETKSFSGAARLLGSSKSLVSKQIGQLEHALGVRLLNRTTRSMSLTEIGAAYYEHCARIAQEIDAAAETAAQLQVEPRGILKLTSPVMFAAKHLAPALQSFLQRHAKVEVELNASDRVVDLVEEGWDLAIRIGRLGDSTLVARKLAPIRTILCATPSYLAAHGTPRTVADLKVHNCLGYTLPTPAAADRWAFGADGQLVVQVSGTFRANNGDALREAALAGIGLVNQPVFLFDEDLRAGRLVALALDQPLFQFANVYAVHATGRHVPAKIRTFGDFLAERWAGEPPWERNLPEAAQRGKS